MKFKYVPLPAQRKLRHLLGSPGVLLRFGGSTCLQAGMCMSVSFLKKDLSIGNRTFFSKYFRYYSYPSERDADPPNLKSTPGEPN